MADVTTSGDDQDIPWFGDFSGVDQGVGNLG
jgi:hypothetical protein